MNDVHELGSVARRAYTLQGTAETHGGARRERGVGFLQGLCKDRSMSLALLSALSPDMNASHALLSALFPDMNASLALLSALSPDSRASLALLTSTFPRQSCEPRTPDKYVSTTVVRASHPCRFLPARGARLVLLARLSGPERSPGRRRAPPDRRASPGRLGRPRSRHARPR